MQPTPRRDPKKFAQRTMAAAIAAAALAAVNSASAQTTGGGIGAAVNAHPNAAAGTVNRGTTPTAGGTTSGVAAPNAPTSPVRVGAGPGINNTGSPAVGVPPALQTPLGGTTSPRTLGTPLRIPGNTIPSLPNPTRVPTSGAQVLGENAVNPAAVNTPAAQRGLTPSPATNSRPNANMRTGTISNFNANSISFREGANTSTLSITPDTVVQMDGRNITMSDIPANSQVRVQRSSTNPNAVQRIVVVPQNAGAAAAANTSVNTTSNTATNTSVNRANAGNFGGGAVIGGTGSGTGTLPSGDINAPNPNAQLPSGDINAPTGTAANQGRPAVTDGSQFLGPVTGSGTAQTGTTVPTGVTANAINATGADGSVALPGNSSSFAGVSGATNVNSNGSVGPKLQQWNAAQTKALDSRLGLSTTHTGNGLTVSNVANNSIAARGGLLSGDSIRSINGQPITSAQDFGRALQGANNQQAISAQVMRDGSLQNVNLSLPAGFFNGFSGASVNGVTGAGAATTGLSPAVSVGANGQVTPGINAGGGVFVSPATSEVNTPATQQSTLDATVAQNERSIAQNTAAVNGTAGGTPAVGAAAATGTAETATTDRTAGQQPTRVRQPEVPVGTQRNPVITEALKVPPFNLGGELKATPEGVVVSSMVNDGLAAKSKIESGDIIETIDGRPITAPGAVAYEMHRHRAGSTVDVGLLRDGKRITRQMKLPENFEPQLLNQNETFGKANREAKDEGASGARPIPVKPTEESRRTLEQENQALKAEIEQLRNQNRKP